MEWTAVDADGGGKRAIRHPLPFNPLRDSQAVIANLVTLLASRLSSLQD